MMKEEEKQIIFSASAFEGILHLRANNSSENITLMRKINKLCNLRVASLSSTICGVIVPERHFRLWDEEVSRHIDDRGGLTNLII